MPQVTQYPRMPRWEYWKYIPPIFVADPEKELNPGPIPETRPEIRPAKSAVVAKGGGTVSKNHKAEF